MTEQQIDAGLQTLELEFGKDRVGRAIEAVKNFGIEIPSWIFGDFGGGRFAGYMPPGYARNIFEKLDDAAFVNKLTGATERIAVHVLWDFSEDGENYSSNIAEQVNQAAGERGLKIGSISPTYFLKGSYRGSLSAMEEDTRARYIDQTLFAAQMAKKVGSNLVTLWFPDGSLYPGQLELRRAFANMRDSIVRACSQMDADITVLVEYKVFEPGTYSTTIPDWGTAYLIARSIGPRAGVLVDLGHHHHATNIEQIVAELIQEGMKGGFHFNTRYAADDDHAVEPNPEMARIFYELVVGEVINNPDDSKNWAYMIDQCSGRENRIHAILHSVDSLQLSLAKAMLVDRDKLESYQAQDEILLANRIFNDALINADVRPIVAAARLDKNLPADPVQAYVQSGYQQKINQERSS